MKKMLFYVIMSVVALTGCNKSFEEVAPAHPVTEESLPTLTATAEDDMTRTYVDADRSICWHSDDVIASFVGTTTNRKYVFTGETGATTGNFDLDGAYTDEGGKAIGAIYGLFPYNAEASISSEGVVSFSMPALQYYTRDSFGATANTMLAVSESVDDTSLRFRNVGGYLKLKLYAEEEGVEVRTLTVRGNNNEKIAGPATATIIYSEAPIVTMGEEAATVVAIDCGEGVVLSTDKENPTIFWVVLPPVEFANGISILLTDSKGAIYTKGTRNALSIVRNEISPMAPLKVDYTAPATTVIYYTTTDSQVVEPNGAATAPFGEAVLLSNEYDTENNRGVMLFDRPLTAIGEDTFKNCSTIQSMTLPTSLESIGKSAFTQCDALTEIAIPASVKSLGLSAFANCDKLQKVIIEEGVETLGNYCFSQCITLNEVNIPASVTQIGAYAFNQCKALTEIVIPSSLTTIGTQAFYNCTNLKDVTLTEGLPLLGSYMFNNCTSLEQITLPKSLTAGEYGFYGCTALKQVELSEGLEFSSSTSAHYMFHGCKGIETITIPSSMTIVPNAFFQNCTALSEVILEEGVTELGSSVFSGCTALQQITLPASLTSINQYAFNNSGLTAIEIPASVCELPGYCFADCASLQSVKLHDGVKKVGQYAFRSCSSLASIDLPEGVTDLSNYAFRECTKLIKIVIPSTVIKSTTSHGLNPGLFWGCSALTEVVLPDGLYSIPNYFFQNCTSLEEITIPAAVTALNQSCFNGCTSLRVVNCLPVTAPRLSTGWVFNNTAADLKVYVPVGSLESYTTANYWSSYASIIEEKDF